MEKLGEIVTGIFLVTIIVVPWFIGFLQFVDRNTYWSKAVKAIQECEKELPRNQYCEAFVTARIIEADNE